MRTFSANVQSIINPNDQTWYNSHNLVTRTEQFDNLWAELGASATADTTTAPNGTLTADTLTTAGGNSRFIKTTQSVFSGDRVKMGCWFKYIDTQWIYLQSQNSGYRRAWFDIQNGVIGSSDVVTSGSTLHEHTITAFGSGWYLCECDFTLTGGTMDEFVIIMPTADGSSTRVSSGSTYSWGASLRKSDLSVLNNGDFGEYKNITTTPVLPTTVDLPGNQFIEYFLLIDLGLAGATYNLTTHKADITTDDATTYLANGAVFEYDAPKQNSVLDRSAYTLQLIDPSDVLFNEFRTGVINRPVTIRAGFVHPTLGPLAGDLDLVYVYRGYVDAPKLSNNFSSKVVQLECSSPMADLDMIRPFYTTESGMDQYSLNDTSFDRINEGYELQLEWGKI